MDMDIVGVGEGDVRMKKRRRGPRRGNASKKNDEEIEKQRQKVVEK